MTQEEIIKVKLFEIIANNSRDLCNRGEYMTPLSVAIHVNDVYKYLFEKSMQHKL